MISVIVNTWLVEIPGPSVVYWIVQLGSAEACPQNFGRWPRTLLALAHPSCCISRGCNVNAGPQLKQLLADLNTMSASPEAVNMLKELRFVPRTK